MRRSGEMPSACAVRHASEATASAVTWRGLKADVRAGIRAGIRAGSRAGAGQEQGGQESRLGWSRAGWSSL